MNRKMTFAHLFFLFIVGQALFGCGQQTKPKTIKKMAKYLEEKIARKTASVPSCLSPSLSAPNTPPQVQYAGYYFANLVHPMSKTVAEFSAGLDEVTGQGNVIGISYVGKDVLGPAGDPDQLLVGKIQKALSKGFKVAIELPMLFFTFDPVKYRYEVSALRADYKGNWDRFRNLIAPYTKSIIAFYPFDEPYLSAWGKGVPFATMKGYLEEMGRLIKTDLPQIPLIFIEGYPFVNNDIQIPSNWDWVGMDCYGSFTKCGEPGKEKSIPEYYNILKSKLAPHQRLIAVPEAFLFNEKPTALDQENLVRRSQEFLTWVESEPLMVGVFAFVYHDIPGEGITGANKMCAVKEFYKKYFTGAKEKFDLNPTSTQATLTIACPTVTIVGESATCTASFTGNLVSGYWLVNGTKVEGSENKETMTWSNLPAGTYAVQALGFDEAGNIIPSNKIINTTTMPAVYCPIPAGYTVIQCNKPSAPYTPGTNCKYQGPQGPGVATCGSDGAWR